MGSSTVQLQYNLARAHLQAGRNQQAIEVLKNIAENYPNEPKSRLMLGFIAQQAGQFTLALDWLGQAIRIDPTPAEPYFISGIAFQKQRRWSEAIDYYQKALSRKPGDAPAMNNLGRCLLENGDVSQAIETFKQGIATWPKNASLISNLGDAHRIKEDLPGAMDLYRQAIAADPRCAEAHGSLGVALAKSGKASEAAASLRQAIAINPKAFGFRFNLARVLQDVGKLEEALRECQAAIELRPDAAEAHNLMGNLLGISGKVPACIAAQQRAVQLKPDFAGAHSNLLLSMQYLPEIPPDQLFAAHLDWASRHAVRSTTLSPYPRRPFAAGQRLRIGYLSPNFNAHSVACFFEPVMAAHDPEKVEIFCYSDVAQPDATTQRLKKMAHHWREIAGKSDAEVLAILRNDSLDVLVDLAGHTAQNRLPIFAHKPAAVQISWIGYPATTGLAAMDYRLTDAIADPPGLSETLHTEKLLRIEGGCWAYQPPAALPTTSPIAPFPSIEKGFVTFGSFNNLPKVTPQVIQAWAKILSLVPNSRLLLKSVGFNSALGRNYVSEQFSGQGIAADRIELIGWLPSSEAHLKLYERVDLALDTFPYNGTTTTCEALWMGVPVITFPGTTHVARVGTALLTHTGLTKWIAADMQGYIDLGVKSAARLVELRELRQNLRDQLKASPLCDANRLARQLEAIYQQAVSLSANRG